MNTIVDKVKEEAKKHTEQHYENPSPIDHALIEGSMLQGAILMGLKHIEGYAIDKHKKK